MRTKAWTTGQEREAHSPVWWSASDIADAVAAGLAERARQDDLEQAVYGFDHLDELGLHPLIHESLRTQGYGVWPEQPYPDDWNRPPPLGRQALRTPCSPRPPATAPYASRRSAGPCSTPATPSTPTRPTGWRSRPSPQFEAGGPFRRYSAELFSPVADDVKKLWADGGIRHAGLPAGPVHRRPRDRRTRPGRLASPLPGQGPPRRRPRRARPTHHRPHRQHPLRHCGLCRPRVVKSSRYREMNNRGGEIRTRDLLTPSQAR